MKAGAVLVCRELGGVVLAGRLGGLEVLVKQVGSDR